MVVDIRERQITYISILTVFTGFITALMYRRVDHIYRTLVALVGLSIPPILHKKALDPPAVLKPLYNEKTVMILSIFIAIHVSLVNVPFTTVDLFHKEWTDADMISHFLGGLTVWLILAEILNGFSNNLNLSERDVIVYSFLIFMAVCLGWEIAEKLSESEISFIHETLLNKARDLLMDAMGALFGLYLVKSRGYPFEFNTGIR